MSNADIVSQGQPALDFSDLVAPPTGTAEADYEPPRHVFFGKKDPGTGKMAKEPVYVHQSFPKMLYKLEAGRIRVTLVDSDRAYKVHQKDGWADSPEEFGYIGAPSQEQILDAKEAAFAAAEAAQGATA